MTDFKPPIGEPPALEWVSVAQLSIDHTYQRSIAAESSQKLIRGIARGWDWRLCQPLDVARRDDGSLWVTDGQHRLEAAKLRPDIPQLPCIITTQSSRSAEAAAFVALNRQRRGLNSVDVFKASLVAGNEEAQAVNRIIREAGLTIAPHSNYNAWQSGMLYCVPGIASAYRRHGEAITSAALVALATAFDKQVLRYAGQMVRALFVVYATEGKAEAFDRVRFVDRLGLNNQQQWMRKAAERVAQTGQPLNRALADVMIDAYKRHV